MRTSLPPEPAATLAAAALAAALATVLAAAPLPGAALPAAAARTEGRVAAAKPAPGQLAAGVRRQLAAGLQVAPKRPAGARLAPPTGQVNPHLGLVADPAKVDFAYWRQVAAAASERREAARTRGTGARRAGTAAVVHDEQEPRGVRGSNDTHAAGEAVRGFGTARELSPAARVIGALSPENTQLEELATVPEDNGSTRLAGVTGVAAGRRGVRTTGVVGDGPHGSAGSGSGDFDFYKVELQPGTQVVADVDAGEGELDPVAVLYDAAGKIVAQNDDEGPGALDSLLAYNVTTAGTYYVMVAGFGQGTVLPRDPADSASGLGAGKEGPYKLTLTALSTDVDHFAVQLAAGDVLGATVRGPARRLAVYDPAGRLAFASGQDASFVYPAGTPLPGGGDAVLSHVAASAGRYTVAVSEGSGGYDLTLEAYRPGPQAQPPATTQTLFLDFDGVRVNTAVWGGPGVRTLAPLSAFLARWGLTAADEGRLVDAVVATVTENLRDDLVARGHNPRFGVKVLSSKDQPDPFGRENVGRVVVGGTIAQAGITTIGVAQSIDPGNFGRQEQALVLLDVLSDPEGTAALNTYLKPASDKIGFLGRALGNVITHEAGHFYGSWHVDQFNDVPNLMDQGGNFAVMYGVGADGVGGTADDVDVDFGEDSLNPNEGFEGLVDTLNTTAFGLTTGAGSRS